MRHSSVVAMQRADGRSFHAGLAVGEVRYGGRDCKLLIVRDLSDSERTRRALETSNRELQAMAAGVERTRAQGQATSSSARPR